jgi:hypothetical protein
MTTRGIVQDGVVILLGPESLPEGAVVSVEVLDGTSTAPNRPGPSLAEELGDMIGSIDDLPADFALNHEHYRFGTPKR